MLGPLPTRTQLKNYLTAAALHLLDAVEDEPDLVLAPSHVTVDLATNWPLALYTKLTAEDKLRLAVHSPLALAERMVKELELTPAFVVLAQTVTAAKPGFINISLSPTTLQQHLTQFVDEEQPLLLLLYKDERILVEYADPNPFKEFHIGHLFNITVGETISRLLQAMGATVTSVCYQGDVGMHVAKSLWGMRQLFDQEGADLQSLATQPLDQRINFLGRAYAAGSTAYEESPEAKLEMQEINTLTYLASQARLKTEEGFVPRVVYTQGREPNAALLAEIAALYTAGRAWSLQYFETIYARLGTSFSEYFFESQSGEYGYTIVRDHVADGVFTKSEGAIVFLGEQEGLHNRVFINSLGLPTYEAKELGLSLLKQDRLGVYDRSVIVTANEIDEYFKVLLRALGKIYPELAAKTKHLSHGMVRLPEGKMSSRTGNILTGTWLLDEAQTRILAILAGTQADMAQAEQVALADQLAVAAVKYALLKSNLGTNIAFSFDDSLSFTGNSGPYLEYTYVRCRSILQKAAVQSKHRSITKLIDVLLSSKSYFDDAIDVTERDVLLYLSYYSDAVVVAAQEYAPHHLCTYLFGLGQRFSRFYEACPILTKTTTTFSPLQVRRLRTVAAVARALREGMTLLGMPVVEQM